MPHLGYTKPFDICSRGEEPTDRSLAEGLELVFLALGMFVGTNSQITQPRPRPRGLPRTQVHVGHEV